MRGVVRTGVLVAVAGVAALTILTLPGPASPPAVELTARDGSDLAVPGSIGVTEARWRELPVIVLVVPGEWLDGPQATPSTDVPGTGLRIIALSAQSTHLGCTVGLVQITTGIGIDRKAPPSPTSTLMDLCHQGQWLPYQSGAHLRGPGDGPLAVLDVRVQEGKLVATAFDGPVGPSRD